MASARGRPGRVLVVALFFALPLSPAHAAEYVQKQGQAFLRLQADKVDAEQVEIPLSGELRMTLSVAGRSPLHVGARDEEVQQEQIKTLLASGHWKTCRAVGSPARTERGEGRQQWQQTFRLDPLRDGRIELQPAPLAVTEGPDQHSFQVQWRPVSIQVTTEIASPDLSDLRDITPIEELPPGWSWQPTALGIGLALAGLGLVVGLGQLLWRRARRTRSLPADRWALSELERIEGLGLPAKAQVEHYHTLLTDVVRRYLELRFGLHAPQQTTAEFLTALAQACPLTPTQQAVLQDFLKRCDLAKFAQVWPSPEECAGVATMARSLVEQTAAASVENGLLAGQQGNGAKATGRGKRPS